MRKRSISKGRVLGEKNAREKEKVGGSKLNLRNSRIQDVKVQLTLGLSLLGWNLPRRPLAPVDWGKLWPKC
jgi:hypothetical protein